MRLAPPGDAGELLTLQRVLLGERGAGQRGVPIPALLETLDDVRRGLDDWTTVVVRTAGRLVGSVRGRLASRPRDWEIGRLMVAPDLEGRGLGRWLLAHVERLAPAEATSYRLFTGAGSERNLRMYQQGGLPAGSPSRSRSPDHGVDGSSKPGRDARRAAARTISANAESAVADFPVGVTRPGPASRAIRTPTSATGEHGT